MSSTVNKSIGAVRYAFKDSKKSLKEMPKKESLIMLHFSYGAFRMKYSTGFHSCYSDWDFSREQLRNKAHLLDRDYVNHFLNDIKSTLLKEVTRLKSENSDITKKVVRKILDEKVHPDKIKKKEVISFFNYVDIFCERKKEKIADVTLRSYRQTERLLKEYNKLIDFEDFNLDFYYDFIRFLEEDDKSLNTIGKHIKNLKSFLKSATENRINKNLAYTSSEFKAPKELTTAIYLTQDEINSMYSLDLSKHPEYDLARDIFLIGCETGQRVSDYNRLTKDNICEIEGVEFFKIKQKKTGREVHCPITKTIKVILDKYNGTPPSKMYEQDLNNYIKEIARRAEITQLVKCNRTKGGKKIVENKPKYELVSTHTARRSFCTNLYKIGLPIYDIMVFSGHSTEKEFYKYIRVEKEKQAVSIAKSGYFTL